MQTTKREDATVYNWSGETKPLLEVEQGETFRVETWDALQGNIYDHGTGEFTQEDVPMVTPKPPGFQCNPLAGPIYVEGAEEGDLLKVNIEDIIPTDQGWTGTMKPLGILHDKVDWEECHGWYAHMIDHEPGPSGTTADGKGIFEINDHTWEWDLNPHIGTIASAPARGSINSLTTQGPWGGNQDIRDVSKGNSVYINSFNEGGMVCLGDVHGSQGDSELTGFADETKAEVELNIEVIKDKQIPGSMRIEKPESIIQVDNAKVEGTPTRAYEGAFKGLMRWLVDEYGFGKREAYIHMSANPDVRINTYQFLPGINFHVTGVEYPKSYLEQL